MPLPLRPCLGLGTARGRARRRGAEAPRPAPSGLRRGAAFGFRLRSNYRNMPPLPLAEIIAAI